MCYNLKVMNNDRDIFRRTLADEAERFAAPLSREPLDAFCLHYDLLRKWNARARLTGSIEPMRAARELFADCLVADRFIESLDPQPGGEELRLVDIGSGAGLPGIPLKFLRPEAQLTLIESNTKKVAFLKTLVNELALSGTDIVRGRAEELAQSPHFRERFDLAFCRAVSAAPAACEFAIPFLRIGGSFVVQAAVPRENPPWQNTLATISAAAAVLNAKIYATMSYDLTGVPVTRLLVEVRKIGSTPARFPRDSKKILKKPIA